MSAASRKNARRVGAGCLLVGCLWAATLAPATATTAAAAAAAGPALAGTTPAVGSFPTTFRPERDDEARALVDPHDGYLVVAGVAGADFGLTRINLTTSRGDPSFGGDSLVTTDFGGRRDAANAVAIAPGRTVVAAGSSDGDVALARYATDGSLDRTFGTAGRVLTDLGGADDAAYGAWASPNGKVVVAGGNGTTLAVLRYAPDGTPDSTFGTGGRLLLPSAGPARALITQPDGQIVVAGRRRGGWRGHRRPSPRRLTMGSDAAPSADTPPTGSPTRLSRGPSVGVGNPTLTGGHPMARVGGHLQAHVMARIRGVHPERCLVVPVDVGKSATMALVADHYGEVVAPFEFALTETGFSVLAGAIARAEAIRSAEVVRVGVESAGHYHRTLVAACGPADTRSSSSTRRQSRRPGPTAAAAPPEERRPGPGGDGRADGSWRRPPPAVRTDALATQAAWVAHHRRKVAARVALANQVIGQLDLVFPGLDGCFSDLLGARAGRVIVTDIFDPDRVRRQGVEGLRRFVARRGVALSAPKAAQVVETARVALRLPVAERAVLGKVWPLTWLFRQPRGRDRHRRGGAGRGSGRHSGRHPHFPTWSGRGAGVELRRRHRRPGPVPERGRRLPGRGAGPGDVRVGRAIPVPPAHQPGGLRRAAGDHRGRPGPVPARGRLPRLPPPAPRLGQAASVAAVAVGHRAHRLPFAMLRDQKPSTRPGGPSRWRRA